MHSSTQKHGWQPCVQPWASRQHTASPWSLRTWGGPAGPTGSPIPGVLPRMGLTPRPLPPGTPWGRAGDAALLLCQVSWERTLLGGPGPPTSPTSLLLCLRLWVREPMMLTKVVGCPRHQSGEGHVSRTRSGG
uniref:Uncharacterized protein n=1 Tax=Pipistrellus kuhlii TaxID=59472 RepID=A0A7J7RAC2_PIPKU|nr:hypothetical protein mPipKuh1_010699 [Pipistrellus kuhlii]